ncbi:glycerol-3-phosphate 1-O-acyltransferase PlsY [Limosilactobacillus fermentum]|uniref:glycerol-3-phosphate 1-O-acyltransferase PlsY n=1 Tax=Limosilactobacillus fermentum TaxID=1613 RepID=UPI00292EE8FF|nr:glycerol-3-phosphate 1-O-acyltransferase PlsY [Limosilactobacillus fermentum]WNY95717.1 glycerol-3-phosphate 1-O-acyltransferase PlsY [Limosilactobacillus fermentum]
MLKIILMVVIAYLLGSIPSGLWIGQHFYNKDIRQLGSGNIGTTNTYRVLGPKAGTVVLVMDILKGTLAASQPYLFHSNINPLLIGIFASLGHTVSIFDHFQGGKAVATSAGILLAYNPSMFLLASAIFVAVLLITSMASAASIIGITSIFVIALVMHDYILATVAGILTAMVIYRHRSNINRIIHGQESMVSFGLGHYLKNRK